MKYQIKQNSTQKAAIYSVKDSLDNAITKAMYEGIDSTVIAIPAHMSDENVRALVSALEKLGYEVKCDGDYLSVGWSHPAVVAKRQHANAGFTLLEVLMAVVIASITMWTLSTLIVGSIKQANKVQKQLNAVSAQKFSVARFPTLNACVFIETGFYGKRTDMRVITVFTSNNCVAGNIGTIGALTNETYFNDVSNKLWVISGDTATLRMLILNVAY